RLSIRKPVGRIGPPTMSCSITSSACSMIRQPKTPAMCWPSCSSAPALRARVLVSRRVARVKGHEQDHAGRPTLVLYCSRSEAQYRVAESMPSPDRAAAIQQQLAELLQTHGKQDEKGKTSRDTTENVVDD